MCAGNMRDFVLSILGSGKRIFQNSWTTKIFYDARQTLLTRFATTLETERSIFCELMGIYITFGHSYAYKQYAFFEAVMHICMAPFFLSINFWREGWILCSNNQCCPFRKIKQNDLLVFLFLFVCLFVFNRIGPMTEGDQARVICMRYLIQGLIQFTIFCLFSLTCLGVFKWGSSYVVLLKNEKWNVVMTFCKRMVAANFLVDL